MKSTLFLLCVLFIALSCEFPLEKENFVEISPLPKSNVQIELKNFPDTLALMEDTNVSYSLNLTGSPAIAILVVVGNDAQYIGYSQSGSFNLSRINQSINVKGYVPFEFAVFSTTSTGSMADKGQRELLLYSVKKTLYFDYSPSVPVNFTKAEAKDGSIFLNWLEYPYPNLRSLKLKRTIYKAESTTPSSEIFILDKNSTTYHDDSFVGVEVVYEIISENNLENTAAGSNARFITKPVSIAQFKSTGTNQLEVKWNKTQFYNNSIGYKLTGGNGALLHSTTSTSDTTAIINNVAFGGLYKLNLLTLSKFANYNMTTTSNVWVGKRMQTPNNIIHHPSDNLFFYSNANYLIKELNSGHRDSVKLQFDGNNFMQFSLAFDGSKIFILSGSDIYEYQTADLVLNKVHSISYPLYSVIPFKNNFIIASPLFSSSSYIDLYNATTGAVIQRYGFSSSTLIRSLYQTPSEEYIIGEGSSICLLKLNSDGAVISDKCVAGNFAIFSRDKNFVYVFDQSTFSRRKYTFPGFVLVPEANTTIIFYSNTPFDRTEGLMAKIQSNVLEITDIETLTIIKRIPLVGNPQLESVRLSGRTVFVDNLNWTYSVDLAF